MNPFLEERVPFSFSIGGRRAKLRRGLSRERNRGGVLITEVEFREQSEPLKAFLICESDAENTHSRLTLKLLADKPLSGPLGGITILDLSVADAAETTTHLYGITGGFFDGTYTPSPDGIGGKLNLKMPPGALRPWSKVLHVGEHFEVDSDRSGRSANSQLPIWVYGGARGGYWLGPEWSGCWHLRVERGAEGSRLIVGLPTFEFVLQEGEQLELPTASFGTYEGDIDRGRNEVRKILLTNLMPKHQGQPPIPLVIFQGLDGMPKYQTEAVLYQEADRAAELGCEAFVFDAGWDYPPDIVNWVQSAGSWEPDAKRFPRGFARFARHVHDKGMKLGCWIEPRVSTSSPAYRRNPDLFLVPTEKAVASMAKFFAGHPREEQVMTWFRKEYGTQALLDLSRASARTLLREQLEHLVALGADWIWFDFNIDPRISIWDDQELPDRKGLLELGFYQGLYEVFDALLKRHLNVWLESCASGGRIIDLGMLRRSHSIWVNDASSDDDINRNLRGGANSLLPAALIQSGLFLNEDVLSKPPAPATAIGGSHRFLTSFGGAFQFGQGLCYWSERDLQEAKRYVAKFKEFRHFLAKDYYRVLPMPENRACWDAWQYHDPSTGSGILVVFRLKDDTERQKHIAPREIKDMKDYRWSTVLGDAAVESDGLGLRVTMSAPNAVLVHYCNLQ